MDENQLTKIIINTKDWFNNKIEQLKHIINAPENVKINFMNDNGETVELPEKDRRAFITGVSVAIEVIGTFPVNITEHKNTEDD